MSDTEKTRDIIKEAIADAKAIREVAVQAAKNELIEQMTPSLRKLVESVVSRAVNESGDRTREQGADYYAPSSREKNKRWEEGKQGETEMADEKGKDKAGAEPELDVEAALAGFFPQVSEEDEADMPPKTEDAAMAIPQLGEEDDSCPPGMKGKKGDEDKDDMIELSTEDIAKFYESVQMVEAQVSKGFKDMVGGGEAAEAAKETGILDKKNGEGGWEKTTPPDAQDYQVKEAIARGMEENKLLRAKLKESNALVAKLGQALHETNLFNAKVLHVNKVLNKHGGLTREQRRVTIESIDKAKSIAQVKMVYETIVSSFAASKSLQESRRPVANAQRVRTSGAPDAKVIAEHVEKQSRGAGADTYSRLQLLAGLTK